jgi:hypothetical protein
MKRLFFVLLFALTALFFSACSSSSGEGDGNGSNQPTPQDIDGVVIIPSGYIGDNIQVCDDKNNSNSCDSGETTVAVNPDAGTFSISASYSLVAEFYSEPRNTLGTSVSSWNGHLPVLVYTTPAGESTVSAFTTMVKNKVDTQPGLYNAISGAEKVKADTDIAFDPFDAGSYAVNAVLHNKVSAVTAGILEYICDTLDITPDTFSAGVILALYNVVYAIVDDIVADPVSADVDNLVNTNKGSADDNAIAGANGTIGEVWDVGNSISGLYSFGIPSSNNLVVAVSGVPLPISTLPPPVSVSIPNSLKIKSATVASPTSITTADRFSSLTFNLGAEAKVYTLVFTEDYSKSAQPDREISMNSFEGATIRSYDNEVVIILDSDTFEWDSAARSGNPFNYDFPFKKSGNFVKTGSGDEEVFTLNATDGSKAILFKRDYGWVLAVYPIFDGSATCFNEAAAQAIIDQWKNNVSPLW